MRVGKLKNGKAAGKDKITGEMIKGGGDRVVDWIWRLCNMAFESGVVPKDWRSAAIVPLYKREGERNNSKENELLLLETERDPDQMWSVYKEMLICCSWLCIMCFKSIEPLDVVRMFVQP